MTSAPARPVAHSPAERRRPTRFRRIRLGRRMLFRRWRQSLQFRAIAVALTVYSGVEFVVHAVRQR